MSVTIKKKSEEPVPPIENKPTSTRKTKVYRSQENTSSIKGKNPKTKYKGEVENPRKKAAKKVVAKGRVTKEAVQAEAAALERKRNEQAQSFLNVMRNNKHLTDEELLDKLAPHMKAPDAYKAGRPAGLTQELYHEKILLAYRLRQRGLNYESIAAQMECNPSTVGMYLTRAKELLTVDPSTISIPENVGKSLNFFEDIREMSLLIASTSSASASTKLSAMRVALDCERDKNAFLATVGVYSAPVMQHFQAMVLNQFVVPSNDAKEVGMEKFFSSVANDLMAHAARRNEALQLIAPEGQILSQSGGDPMEPHGGAQDVEYHNA